MKRIVLFVLAASLGAAALAQQPPPRPQGPPPRIDFAKELGLTGERAKQVEAIMRNEHEEHRAAREKARTALARVLSADEMARLESLMPRPRGPMGPPPERR
jgi:Spy/CpxP family protein refolding chaperone